MKDLESFLELDEHVGAMRQRENTRRAAAKMVNLIDEILNYICNLAPSGLSGMYFIYCGVSNAYGYPCLKM